MRFSNIIKPGQADKQGLFPVQNPDLYSKILPLFSFDPRVADKRPLGHGTAFRVDMWGTCATAFHVVEELLTAANGNAVLRKDIRLAALEFDGIGYGEVPLPNGSWRPFSGMFSFCGIETLPVGSPQVRNVTELAALRIAGPERTSVPTPFLPVDLQSWRPEPGQRVTAFGFADLDIDDRGEGDARAMTHYLYGSQAIITEVRPPNGESSRPWPVFHVEAEWPGGMSGGPVFNDAGHVIGIVSSAVVGVGIGTATSFSGWNFAERTFRTVCPNNPGMLQCWGAFGSDGQLITYAPARELVELLVVEGKARTIREITINPETSDYFSL